MRIEASTTLGGYATLEVEIDNTLINSGLHDEKAALEAGQQLLRAAYDLLHYSRYIAAEDLDALDKIDDVIGQVSP